MKKLFRLRGIGSRGGRIHCNSMDTTQRQGTVCFIVDNDKVLLALIEYGPLDQKWNGIGGFAEAGESLEDCVVREYREETHIIVDPKDLRKATQIDVSPELMLHVFVTNVWTGELRAKEDSIKGFHWFPKNQLPYAQMFSGSVRWLPQALLV